MGNEVGDGRLWACERQGRGGKVRSAAQVARGCTTSMANRLHQEEEEKRAAVGYLYCEEYRTACPYFPIHGYQDRQFSTSKRHERCVALHKERTKPALACLRHSSRRRHQMLCARLDSWPVCQGARQSAIGQQHSRTPVVSNCGTLRLTHGMGCNLNNAASSGVGTTPSVCDNELFVNCQNFGLPVIRGCLEEDKDRSTSPENIRQPLR